MHYCTILCHSNIQSFKKNTISPPVNSCQQNLELSLSYPQCVGCVVGATESVVCSFVDTPCY